MVKFKRIRKPAMAAVPRQTHVVSKCISVGVLLFCMMITAVHAEGGVLSGEVDIDEGIIKISSEAGDTEVQCSFDNKSWFSATIDDTKPNSWILNITTLSASKNAKIYFYGDVSDKVAEYSLIKAAKMKWKAVYSGIDIPEKGYQAGMVNFPEEIPVTAPFTGKISYRTFKEAGWKSVVGTDGVDAAKLEANGGTVYIREDGVTISSGSTTTYYRPSAISSVKVSKAAAAPKVKLNQTTGYLSGISTKMEVQIFNGNNSSASKNLASIDSTIFAESEKNDGWYVFKGKGLDLSEVVTGSNVSFVVRVPATEKKPASREYRLYLNGAAAVKPTSSIGAESEGVNIGMSYVNERITVDRVNQYEYVVVPLSTPIKATTSLKWKTLTSTDTSIATLKPTTSSSLYIRRKAVISAANSDYTGPSEKISFPLNVRPTLKAGKYSKFVLTMTTNAAIEATKDNSDWYSKEEMNIEQIASGRGIVFWGAFSTSQAVTVYYRTPASDEDRVLPSATMKLNLPQMSDLDYMEMNAASLFEESAQRVWDGIERYFPSLKQGMNKQLTGDYNTSGVNTVNLEVHELKHDSKNASGTTSFEIVGGRGGYSVLDGIELFTFESKNQDMSYLVKYELMHNLAHKAMERGFELYDNRSAPWIAWFWEGAAQAIGGSGIRMDLDIDGDFRTLVNKEFGSRRETGTHVVGYYAVLYLSYLASGGDMDALDSLSEGQLLTALRGGLDKIFYEFVYYDYAKNHYGFPWHDQLDDIVRIVTSGKKVEYKDNRDFIEKLKGEHNESFHKFYLRIQKDMTKSGTVWSGQGSIIASDLSVGGPANILSSLNRSTNLKLRNFWYNEYIKKYTNK